MQLIISDPALCIGKIRSRAVIGVAEEPNTVLEFWLRKITGLQEKGKQLFLRAKLTQRLLQSEAFAQVG